VTARSPRDPSHVLGAGAGRGADPGGGVVLPRGHRALGRDADERMKTFLVVAAVIVLAIGLWVAFGFRSVTVGS